VRQALYHSTYVIKHPETAVSSKQAMVATGLQTLNDTPATAPAQSLLPLMQQCLAEQQELTAVERFGQLHDREELPNPAQYYRSLMPLSPPGPGQ